MPMASSGTSTAGTSACSSSAERSTTVTSGASKPTFSPGWTCRRGDDAGQRRGDHGVLERVARDLHLRLRRLHAALRHVEARLGVVESVLRDEVLLQQRAIGRTGLLGHARAAPAPTRARPMRSTSRASRSAVSMRASTCPARTASPSRTETCLTSPDTLALTTACRSGCSVPDTGRQPRERLGLDRGEVGRARTPAPPERPWRPAPRRSFSGSARPPRRRRRRRPGAPERRR